MSETLLTDAVAREAAVPDGKREVYLRDSKQPGFALRVRKSGGRCWVFFSTRPGHKGSHKTTIGPFPKIGAADARKRAKVLAGKHAAGVDLIAERRERKQAAIQAEQDAAKAANVVTFGSLVAERIEDGKDMRPYAI